MERNFLIFVLSLFIPLTSLAAPFSSSLDIGSNIFVENDESVPFDTTYEGVSTREVLDKRVGEIAAIEMFIFTTVYADGVSVEYQVNPEFGDETSAQAKVLAYAQVIGQLPFVLRSGIDVITVHGGNELLAAGCGGVDGKSSMSLYDTRISTHNGWGSLEEVLAHESAHTSLDCLYKYTDGWSAAQQADGVFISQHAHDKPIAEDMAESFLAYLALFRCDRVGEATCTTIMNTIPNRIAFFERLNLNLEPLVDFPAQINAGFSDIWANPATSGQGFYVIVLPKRKKVSLAWFTYDTERPPEDVTAVFGDPGHRWATGLGPYEGDTAELTLYCTEGGVFDSELPKAVTGQEGCGTLILEFEDCMSGFVHYDIPSIGRVGSIPVWRIADDNVELCEMLATMND